MGNEEVDLVTVANPAKKKSLLERYDIPIEHLSFEYINESKDVKELERIVLILRSGEEGSYPDLTKHAEKRLAEIKPGSSVLRVSEPVLTRDMLAPERRQKLENDMNQWMNEMKLREKDLEEGRSMQITEPVPQPDIRQIKLNENKKKQPTFNQNKNKRISACDYAAWDKYDADTEINRIDLQHEKKQVDIKRTQQKHREKEEKIKKTSREAIVNNLTLTGTEYNVMAEEERKKGNEAFKAGDYEEALQFYDLSIAIDASIQAYNNRAITFIKLQRYTDAVKDCNRVISEEHTNIKALLRRALALEHLEKKSQALADYEAVLKLEPANKVAITAINKLRGPCNSKKITMKIEEVTATEENSVMKISDVKKTETNSNQAKSKLAQEKSKEKSITYINEANTTSQNSSTVPSHSSTSSGKSSHQTQPQVCFCNNAPSSSQHISPLPHMRNSYCSKNLEKSSGFPKLQSIFTNTKMSSDKSSGVIIEEIPNEPLEEPVKKSNNKKTNDTVAKKPEENNMKTILGSGDTPNNIAKKSPKLIEEIPKKEVNLKENIKKNIKFNEISSGVIIEEIPNEEFQKPVEKSGNKINNKKAKKLEEKNVKTILGSGDTPNNKAKIPPKLTEEISKKGVNLKENIKKDIKFDETSSGVIIEEIPNEPFQKRVENAGNKINNDKVKKHEEKNVKTIFGSGDTPNNIVKKSPKLTEEISKKGVNLKENIKKDIKFDEASSGVIIEEITNEPIEKFENKKNNDRARKLEEKNVKSILGSGDTPNNTAKKLPQLTEEVPKKEVNLKDNIKEKNIKCNEISSGVIIEKIPNEPVEESENKINNDKAKKLEEKNMKTVLGSGDISNNEAKESPKLIEEITEKKVKPKEDITKDIKFDKISTPYEFLKVWHSLKNDSELILRAKLLLCLTPENIDTVIGNKLDGDMLGIILRCFERHFCIPEQSKTLHRFLQSLTKVKRFSMICMFMNEEDTKVKMDADQRWKKKELQILIPLMLQAEMMAGRNKIPVEQALAILATDNIEEAQAGIDTHFGWPARKLVADTICSWKEFRKRLPKIRQPVTITLGDTESEDNVEASEISEARMIRDRSHEDDQRELPQEKRRSRRSKRSATTFINDKTLQDVEMELPEENSHVRSSDLSVATLKGERRCQETQEKEPDPKSRAGRSELSVATLTSAKRCQETHRETPEKKSHAKPSELTTAALLRAERRQEAQSEVPEKKKRREGSDLRKSSRDKEAHRRTQKEPEEEKEMISNSMLHYLNEFLRASYEEVDVSRVTRHGVPPGVCFNCHEYGHRYWHCPEPRDMSFCVWCGRRPYTVANCPGCSSNWRAYWAEGGPKGPTVRSRFLRS